METKRTFMVKVLGFKKSDTDALRRCLRLSKSRSRRYALLEESTENNSTDSVIADIEIADIDYAVSHSIENHLGSLVIAYGKDSINSVTDDMLFTLKLPLNMSKIFSVFDRITTEILGFIPELTVGAVAETSSDMLDNEPEKVQSFINASISKMYANYDFNVLVVDDSPVIREQMKIILETLGLTVELCDSGEAALSNTRQKHYDIIFMDVVMPGMNGFEACKKIKYSSPIREHIIMLTSEDSSISHVKGRWAGAASYMTKPVTIEALVKQLALFVG